VEGSSVNTAQCVCGFTQDEAGDQTLGDHLLEAFAPEDDKGPDGIAAATPDEVDAHLIAKFTPTTPSAGTGRSTIR
jgi:hypothetical protein